MAYIGNARTLLVFGPNAQDDIVPDGVASTFELSQEVPGGYEGNILVVRKRYILDELVSGSTSIDIVNPNQIQINSDQDLAAGFSIISVADTNNDASNIIISGANNAVNNDAFQITGVAYNGNTITITVFSSNLVSESGSNLTINWGRTTNWEVLEPEIDYVISGINLDYNKLITFGGGYIPSVDDQIYVIHKGDATYNFVPSQSSVGPEQLQINLRNFVCDRYIGDGSTTAFALSQEAINSKTLLVTLDGIESDGDDPDQSFLGDWELDVNGLGITFIAAPANTVKIRILHLSFSTVSRRATLSPGQAGLLAPGTVNNASLGPDSITTDKIAAGAVTNTDIASDAVNGNKILLNNDENLRGKDFAGTARNLLKINGSDQTVLNSQNDTLIQVSGTTRIRLDSVANALVSETNNDIALGTTAKRYSALYVQNIDATTLTVTGNIILPTPGATVDGVDLSALQTTIANLQSQVNTLIPAGTMQMWMIDGAAPAGYLLCHGQEVSQAIFPTLFAAISTTFNIGTEAAGNFRLPNLRQRSPLGKALSGTGSGWGSINGTGGIIDHDHTTASHVHGIPHTHAVPGHYHQMGNGSTLNITNSAKTSASAGTHVHSLTSVTTNAGEGNHTHTNNFFSGNISFTDINHSHTGTATSLGSAHRHTIPNRSIDAPAGTFPADFRPHIRPNVHHLLRGGNNLEGGATGSDLFGQDEGSHTHTLNIAPVGTFFHTHALGSLNITSSGAHAHGLTGTTDSTPNHSHAIDHSHGANEFTGSIGFRNGLVDGDSNFNSGQPNNANSSASTPVSTTTNNSPFHTVHFIIKT